MMWSMALNGVFIVVMAIGIVFVWRLQLTLNGLYKNRAEMEKFVSDFSASIARAEKAIRGLQETARDVGQDVEGQLARAHGLRDELSFLVEAADKVASRLSDSASTAQHDVKQARAQRAEKAQEIKASENPAPIMQNVQKPKGEPVAQPAVKKVEAVPAPEPAPASTKTVPTWIKRAEQNAPIINAPVEEVAPVSGLQFGARKAAQKNAEVIASVPVEKDDAKEQPKSLAERELLQALEKMK
ncbi:MAG: hypothetical protein K2Q32_03980 [Alphaproteobacteria bacterium]|nr:hypothetical protein [Alphaproteobacteria bacterium]